MLVKASTAAPTDFNMLHTHTRTPIRYACVKVQHDCENSLLPNWEIEVVRKT